MLLSTEAKRALRRLQSDNFMSKKQLANYINVSEKTVQRLTKDDLPQEVKTGVYEKIMTSIAKNY
ncbi:helix-turn-helix domain-containing protein [Lactococcus garvieae]|uniref:helix-turn-helix domain-containing protein n=1 Tax=Lactococcus garvieae TaxID=1363 RepID=UPI00254DB2EC|nr:helix-turn-helix domain-containing protein [Lactococcus garvieae]